MGASAERETLLRAALATDRRFSYLFGGYGVELPEAHLVVNERLPAPRFNWVQDLRCAPGRVTAFLERTLDHYYQRALRPTFELRSGEIDAGIEKALGLADYVRLAPERRRQLLRWDPARAGALVRARPPGANAPAPLSDEELPAFAELLVLSRQQPEVVRCIQVAQAHPNPGEKVAAYAIRGTSGLRSVALFARHGREAGLFAVGTRPEDRSQGLATELVAAVLRAEALPEGIPVVLSLEGPEPPAPLVGLGFEPLQSFDVFAIGPAGERKGF
jgi:ribosomal protein S18 acetylase RimI-like enzyme